jgi:hypothetical protein
MRKFDYRAPRFAVDLPVRLTFDHSTQPARCTEISTEGMRLEVNQPLQPQAYGTVSVSYQDFDLDLPVRVAHAGPYYDGVKFIYASEEQRDEVNRLVMRLSSPQKTGPVLIR